MDIYASSNGPRESIICKVADVLREERSRATDIESAVDKAAVNRDEVHATFGSMHALILEMVSDLSGALVEPLQDRASNRSVREVLIDFGNRLANSYSSSHLIALYRIALTEATRHSGIGREFFERGPRRLTTCLEQFLEQSAHRSDQPHVHNPKLAADSFLSLLRANLELADGLPVTKNSAAEVRYNPVFEAVELFCHGIISEGH